MEKGSSQLATPSDSNISVPSPAAGMPRNAKGLSESKVPKPASRTMPPRGASGRT